MEEKEEGTSELSTYTTRDHAVASEHNMEHNDMVMEEEMLPEENGRLITTIRKSRAARNLSAIIIFALITGT